MLDLLIITGASKGIGASIASKCASICRKMIIIASSNAIWSKKIENSQCAIIPLQLDLSDCQRCHDVIKNTIDNSDDIKSVGIVLCGGQIGEPGGLFQSNLNDWNKLYQCNVLGNLAVVKSCSEIIKNGAKTRIVFFGGGGAAFPYPDFSGYALSKVAVVRAVENLSIELSAINDDTSIVALAPGAVDTDILKKVLDSGSTIRTRTDISEPTNFVYNFLTDVLPSKELNGRFLHVRDEIKSPLRDDLFRLRRVQ